MTVPQTALYWLTDEHVVELCNDLEAWGAWIENASSRRVAETTLHDGRWVSTVFLGIDHRFGTEVGSPIVFETMVFPYEAEHGDTKGGWQEEASERYSTWDEAMLGHWRMVRERTLSLCEDVS